MKLNPDCIRDVLVAVESVTTLNQSILFNPDSLPNDLSSYPPEVVMYHVKQCELSGLFGGQVSWFLNGACLVPYLSPSGHQFLSDIRNDSNWNKTKEIAKNVGSESLSAIKDIAAGIISSLIQRQLGLL